MSTVIVPDKQKAILEISELINLSIKKKDMIIDERLANQCSYIMALIENESIKSKLNDLINFNSLGRPFNKSYRDKLKGILNTLMFN